MRGALRHVALAYLAFLLRTGNYASSAPKTGADIFDYIERCHNPRQRRRLELQKQGERLLTQPSVISG